MRFSQRLAIYVAVGIGIITGAAAFLLPPPPPQDEMALLRDYVVKLSLVPFGNGSGVVIRPGLVLTAKHVSDVQGLHTSEKSAVGVTVAGGDGTVDLGLLYYPAADATCPCVKLADHDAEIGEAVWIVGYPLGVTKVVTYGTAQGVKEHIYFPAQWGDMEDLGRRLVLTASAQPGNSGGGAFVLRNGEWQLVGIVVQVTASAGGSLTFAIPVSDVRAFLAQHA